MEIGERIRTERIKRGLTQRKLAAAVGIGQDSVSMHEAGKMGVSMRALRGYARVFGVKLDELAGSDSAAA